VVGKGSCLVYGGRSCHGSPVVANQASSCNKLFQRASGRWKVFAARGGVSTKSNVSISLLSVSGKASTVAPAASIGQAQGFSFAEILAPPQYLEPRCVLVVRHCLVGESAAWSSVIRNESERAVRVHKQDGFVRNVSGWLSRMREHLSQQDSESATHVP